MKISKYIYGVVLLLFVTSCASSKRISSEVNSDKKVTTTNFVINYDVRNFKFEFPKSNCGKNIKMPPIGGLIEVIPIGNLSTTDSIRVSFQYGDNSNLENQGTFLSNISGTQTQQPLDNQTKSSAIVFSEKVTENRKDSLITLNKYLTENISELNSQHFLDPSEVRINALNLKSTILSFLKDLDIPTDINPKTLILFLKENNPAWLLEEEKPEWEKLASLWNKIEYLSYSKVFTSMVKDNDITDITISHFSNGLKINENSFTLSNRGGLKIDFSTGPLASGLIDQEFDLVPTNSFDTTRIFSVAYPAGILTYTDSVTGLTQSVRNRIVSKETGNYKIGVGILLHAYPRIGKAFNLSFTLGTQIRDQSTISYFLGGSAILGKKQRFIASFGIMAGRVNRLSNKYELGQLVNQEVSSVTSEQWKTAFALGVTYNLRQLINSNNNLTRSAFVES